MDMINAVKVFFPLSAEGADVNNVYTPNPSGRWEVTDAKGDVVCECPTWEVSSALADLMNLAYAQERELVVEITH